MRVKLQSSLGGKTIESYCLADDIMLYPYDTIDEGLNEFRVTFSDFSYRNNVLVADTISKLITLIDEYIDQNHNVTVWFHDDIHDVWIIYEDVQRGYSGRRIDGEYYKFIEIVTDKVVIARGSKLMTYRPNKMPTLDELKELHRDDYTS